MSVARSLAATTAAVLIAQAQAAPDVLGLVGSLNAFAPNVANGTIYDCSVDGANLAGRNRKEGRWITVAEQRWSAAALLTAVAKGNKAGIDTNLRGIEWTLDQMQPDGSFVLIDTDTMEPSKGKAKIASAGKMFLAHALPALMALRAKYPGYATRVNALKPQLALAAGYVYQYRDRIFNGGSTGINRQIRLAAVLIESGLFLRNPIHLEDGRAILRLALASQWDNGVFPEEGGYDTSYQLVSLMELAKIQFLDPTPEGTYALRRGCAWSLHRFLEDGRIDATGNTRTMAGVLDPMWDEEKLGHYPPAICTSLALSARYLGNARLADALARFSAVAFVKNRIAPPLSYIYVAR
ncbi:MAG TPA: hypothetical protein VGE01_08805 [Fimbriimonas sp.]